MVMTSKERVRRAIQHKSPDRVPCFMNCVKETAENLQKHLGLETLQDVQDSLDIDIRNVDAPYIGPELPRIVHSDGSTEVGHWLGHRSVLFWNGMEYNSHVTFRPLAEMKTVEELDAWNWPNPEYFDYEVLRRDCTRYPNRALRIGWPGVFQVAGHLAGEEKLYMDMAGNPEFAQHLFNKLVDFEVEYYGRMFEAADGQLDMLCVCDDYGTQNSMLFSKGMWEQFFATNTRRLTDLCHKSNAFYVQHSCGAIREIIPSLINCGVDVLDPIQKVTGMEPERLKTDFGDKICFHGGIDTQNLLPHGTPEQVCKETEYFIDVLNRNGGYILGPSQSFEGDVPVENILALYSVI
jgi:uroporphyrinogen decarboxylase